MREAHALAPLVGAGNQAIQALVTSAAVQRMYSVQRDLATDTRSDLNRADLDLAEFQLVLARLSGLSEDQLATAVRRVTNDAWLNVVIMSEDASVASSISWAKLNWVRNHSGSIIGTLARLDVAQVAPFITWLSPASRRTLASTLRNSYITTDAQRAAVRAIFDAVPDGETTTLVELIRARFDVRPKASDNPGEVGDAFGPSALRRIYNVFQSLPPGAIETNPALVDFKRYRVAASAGGGGYYASETQGIAMGYSSLTDLDSITSGGANPSRQYGFGPGAAGPGGTGAMAGQNVFDEVVRHEVGHAVDQRLGLKEKYCLGPSAKGGAWLRQPTASVANDLVTASAGPISALPDAQKTGVIRALQSVVNDRVPGSVANRVSRALRRLVANAAARRTLVASIMTDPAAATLGVSFADLSPGNPWYNAAGGGVAIGGRVTQEAYAGEWWSYDQSIRSSRSVSDYQFRSPFEWIAEAYNAYYAPPTKGAALASIDADAKTWFDTNVDVATGGQGAAGAGPALPAAASGPGFH